jgi:hypothetical protein
MENKDQITKLQIQEKIALNSIEVMLNGRTLSEEGDYFIYDCFLSPNRSACISFSMNLMVGDRIKFIDIHDGKVYKIKTIEIPKEISTDKYIDLKTGEVGKLLPKKYKDSIIFV